MGEQSTEASLRLNILLTYQSYYFLKQNNYPQTLLQGRRALAAGKGWVSIMNAEGHAILLRQADPQDAPPDDV